MVATYLFIILIVSILTIIAIKQLPDIDKSFSMSVEKLVDYDCDISDAVTSLVVVNSISEGETVVII